LARKHCEFAPTFKGDESMAARGLADFSALPKQGLPSLRREMWTTAIRSVIVLAAAAFLSSCSGGGGTKEPVPSILNINSSTTPSSPVGLPIEINGSGFQTAPGKVVFTQGSVTATVVPSSSGWSDTGIVATVPSGNGTTSFTVPGTVNVTVVTSGGTSNAVTLDLIAMLTFNVNNVTWAQTTALPMALTGLRAAVVPAVSSTSAFVVVTGGYDGTSNQTRVFSNTLNSDGTVGGSWISIITTQLPITLAHHGMAEADPTNSLVSTNSRFVYVIGGQQNSTDAPGGLTSVYQASVDPTTGVVGTWTQLTNSSLPESLVGPAVTIFNGQIYVVGGLRVDGTPSPDVFSAPVNPDGSLGTWTKQANPYPTAVSFATAFGFGGKLYVIDGDPSSSTDPNAQGSVGTNAVNFAGATRGTVGIWTATATTIKSRKKHITWTAFGQVIAAEGVYAGNPGSLELERTLVNSDSTLASWNGITASSNQINANVYNAAAFVSPLLSSTNTPRFLLLGGQAFTLTPPGTLSNTVYYNNAP
jgi:N-acetylneuraminic acid mutarotase